jgi:hypothetical protein
VPTENWYPISGAAHDLPAGTDDWVTGGSGDTGQKPTNVRVGGGRSGPATHDDNTTYITETTNGEDQGLNIDWPGPMAALGSTFNANWRTRTGGATSRSAYIMDAAGNLGTAWGNLTSNDAGYVDQGPIDISDAATYRPTGGSWGIADFANEQTMFAKLLQYSAGQTVCTSVWGAIEYTPPGGGFAFLLNLAGLAAPIAGAMDFGHFMRFLAWRRVHHPRHTLMRDRDEIMTAWREVKSYRHPRFFYGFAQ